MVEPLTGGIIGCAFLLISLFSGLPVAVSLGLSGMVGIYLIEGTSGVFLSLPGAAFEKLTSIGQLAVPMFIFMGNLIIHHKIGNDLYDTVYKWLGRLPGGLAIASTGFCALFGFMCGSGLAGAATVGGIAIPEMEKKGYSRKLSTGTLALAGTLAALIPPSVLMIIFATETYTSMGALFVGGIFPGILLAALMGLFIGMVCLVKPELGPKGESFSFMDKIKSLIHLMPVAALFLTVLGGIYAGIWSPMEAGASACLAVIIIAVLYKRLKWSRVREAALDAAKTSIMVYMLIVGASILSLMFFISGLSEVIKLVVIELPLPRWGIIVLLLFILMIMGMFMDVMAMLFISLPIFMPIVVELGYHPVWWGIIMIVACEMALITPPVGVNLFVIKGIAPRGTTLMDVALGAAPFVLVLWVFLGLLVAFPEIVMWLPNRMKG